MQVLWGRELRRCAKNPYPVAGDPYDAKAHNKWNRKKLHKLKAGSTIEYRPKSPCYCPPTGAAPVAKKHPDVWVKTKVLRVVRVGNVRPFDYTVPAKRCLHQDSVRCTARMVRRARRNNKLWGEDLLPPATLKERHIVTPKTFDHLRDFIFSTDFVELLKARCITSFYLPVHCIRSLLLSIQWSYYQGTNNTAGSLLCSTWGGSDDIQKVFRECSWEKLWSGLRTSVQAGSLTQNLHQVSEGSLHVLDVSVVL